MKKKYWRILPVLLLLLLSCTETGTEGKDSKFTVNLDSIPTIEEFHLSSFIKKEDCSIVLLDTATNALMGHIDKLKIYHNYIVTLDKNVARGIFIFNQNGCFLNKIGQKGQGPGEYVSPSDFTCSLKEDKIFVLDSRLRKILIYSLSTGEFLRDIRIEPYALRIHYYEGNLYVDNPSYGQYSSEGLLARINIKTGECEEYMISPDTFNAGYDGSLGNEGGPFLQSGTEQFNYSQVFANAILKKEDSHLYPYLQFISKDWMNTEDIAEINMKDFSAIRKLISKNKYYDINCFMETEDVIFCRFRKGVQTPYFFYDRKNEKMYLAKDMKDDIHFSNASWPFARLFYGGYDDEGFCMYQSPQDAERVLAKECYNDPRFERLHQLGENFNGAVFFYKFKK